MPSLPPRGIHVGLAAIVKFPDMVEICTNHCRYKAPPKIMPVEIVANAKFADKAEA